MNSFSAKKLAYNDYQYVTSTLHNQPNNEQSLSRTKNFHFVNTPQKNKYQYGMFSKRYVQNNTASRNNISANGPNLLNKSSRMISQNNSMINVGGGLLNSQQLYSQQMIFLLSDQQNNIRYFKERIDSQRQKIQRQFQNMKKKIMHIIQDLKISFQAQLDKAYLNFINKYRQFKVKMNDLRDVRKALLDQNILNVEAPPNEYLHQLNNTKNISISNRDLLNEIQKDAKLFRNHKLFNHISQLQRQRIQPAKRITQQLIALGGIDKQYYKESQTRQLISRLIAVFQRQIQQVYGDILDNYVISTQKMIRIHFQTKEQNTMILNGLQYDNKSVNNLDINNVSRFNYKSLDQKDLNRSNATYVNQLKNNHNINQNQANSYQYGMSSPRKNQLNHNHNTSPPRKHDRPASHSIDYLNNGGLNRTNRENKFIQDRKISQYEQQKRQRPVSDWKSQFNVSNTRNFNIQKPQRERQNRATSNKGTVGFSIHKIGPEQQNFSAQWIQEIKLKQVGSIDASQNLDAMLCCIFANKGKQIVTGGKDKTVRVYDSVNGKLICSLQGHKASICSIANHDDFISTGGDNGCSSLILWQTRTWTIHSKIQAHTTALTSIVDLQDGQNLVTGSYDKKIVIYNYRSNLIVDQIKNGNAAIACMSLTSDWTRLVTSGLNSTISVWRINKNKGPHRSISIEIQNTFSSNGLVCSMRCLSLRYNLCVLGTKQGKVQIINLNSGETVKKLAVSGSSVIELVLFQRQNKNEWPLVLSCSAKQKSLVLTKTETGINSFIDVKGKLNVDFGCGIGPKVILSQSGHLAILSQSSSIKQINIYKINVL